MPKKVIIYAGIAIVISAIIFYFINYTVSVGLVVGYLFSLVYLGILTLSIKLLGSEQPNGLLVGLGAFLRMLVLALPLLLAGLFPQRMNIFGVFFGLIMFKFSLYLSVLINKGGL